MEQGSERRCKHCGQLMKRIPSEHCWVCFGVAHDSRLIPHREFDSAAGRCFCTECDQERENESAP
jgi:hypothetical protein